MCDVGTVDTLQAEGFKESAGKVDRSMLEEGKVTELRRNSSGREPIQVIQNQPGYASESSEADQDTATRGNLGTQPIGVEPMT